jgi:tyrosinase
MHIAVGGWMSSFETAALDPIFWLHHANIDRLWDVWRQRDGAHRDPNQAFWRSGVRFDFRQADGNPSSMTVADVIDAQSALLDYRYDDVSDPLGVPEAAAAGTLESAVSRDSMPEMVGATPAPFEIGEGTSRAVIPTALPAPSGLESAARPKRVYLHLEHLTSEQRAPAYDVYLGVPEGVDPTAHPTHHAGRISTFGLESASRPDGPHAGSGLTVALDVTDVVQRLRSGKDWKPDQLGIAFVPVRGGKGARVRVGRVSLYTK